MKITKSIEYLRCDFCGYEELSESGSIKPFGDRHYCSKHMALLTPDLWSLQYEISKALRERVISLGDLTEGYWVLFEYINQVHTPENPYYIKKANDLEDAEQIALHSDRHLIDIFKDGGRLHAEKVTSICFNKKV